MAAEFNDKFPFFIFIYLVMIKMHYFSVKINQQYRAVCSKIDNNMQLSMMLNRATRPYRLPIIFTIDKTCLGSCMNTKPTRTFAISIDE